MAHDKQSPVPGSQTTESGMIQPSSQDGSHPDQRLDGVSEGLAPIEDIPIFHSGEAMADSSSNDTNSQGETSSWTLDRHIPVAFLIGLAVQLAGIVWWGSQVQTKQEEFERRLSIQESAKTAERMAVLEEQLRASKEIQTDMNKKLDRLLDLTFAQGRVR